MISFTIITDNNCVDLYLYYILSDDSTIHDSYILNSRGNKKRYATLRALLLDIVSIDPDFSHCRFIINEKGDFYV